MRSKTYKKIKENMPTEPIAIDEAVAWLKNNSRSSFDETIELHIHLGVDPQKSDQMVRGTATLPAGNPKKPTIVVFTEEKKLQREVASLGVTESGGEELIEKISQTGSVDADITVATPSMMPKLAKIAKILGPKGLMPNPKTGTVTPNPAETIKDLLGGKKSFKMDQQGNIHAAIAKTSWAPEKISDNAKSFIQAVNQSKPQGAKGELIKDTFIKTTMGPSIKITT